MNGDIYMPSSELINRRHREASAFLLGGRIPPQSIDMEQSVIGSMITSYSAIDRVCSVIRDPSVFYKESHAIMFRALVGMKEDKVPMGIIELRNRLSTIGQLEAVGGAYYITVLHEAAQPSKIEYHCTVISQKAMSRGLIKLGQELMSRGFDETADPFVVIEDGKRSLSDLLPQMSGMSEASDFVVPVIEDAEAAMRGESKSLYLGFNDIDANYAYEPGELVLIPGDSGTGKTALAWQVAKRMRKRYPAIPVIFNSLEMNEKQLVGRDLASTISISQMKLRTGHGLERDHVVRMSTMEDRYKGIYITQCWTNDMLAGKIRQLRNQLGLKIDDPVVVFSDNLQIMVGKSDGNREQEVASIGRSAKIIAQDEKVLYFLLAQLNKANGKDRPTKKNVRESTAPGNDSDWVMILYSPSVNGEAEYSDGSSTDNVLEVIMDKVRFGKPGAVIKLHMNNHGLIGDMSSHGGGEDPNDVVYPKMQPKDITIPNSERLRDSEEKGDDFPF